MAVYHADEPDPETVENEGIVHIRIHIHAFEHPDGICICCSHPDFCLCIFNMLNPITRYNGSNRILHT